jgi:hypothetical protein
VFEDVHGFVVTDDCVDSCLGAYSFATASFAKASGHVSSTPDAVPRRSVNALHCKRVLSRERAPVSQGRASVSQTRPSAT